MIEIRYFSRKPYAHFTSVCEFLDKDERALHSNLQRYMINCKQTIEFVQKKRTTWIPVKMLEKYIAWVIDTTFNNEDKIYGLRLELSNMKIQPKRKISKSNRIEIAFRQQYKCNLCDLFPIPPTFEVDHIIELQDGGLDHIDNLQVLCVACHAKKTRNNMLSKQPLFQAPQTSKLSTQTYSNIFNYIPTMTKTPTPNNTPNNTPDFSQFHYKPKK